VSQGLLSEVGTVLPCVDIERSKHFHRDVLGLEVEETPEMPGNVVVRVGETSKLFLYQRDAPNKADHTQATCLTDGTQGRPGSEQAPSRRQPHEHQRSA